MRAGQAAARVNILMNSSFRRTSWPCASGSMALRPVNSLSGITRCVQKWHGLHDVEVGMQRRAGEVKLAQHPVERDSVMSSDCI